MPVVLRLYHITLKLMGERIITLTVEGLHFNHSYMFLLFFFKILSWFTNLKSMLK